MPFTINLERKKKICERVRQVRIKNFGEGWGAQKEMARVLGIPYTTYRGYEATNPKDCRINDEFLRVLGEKFGVPFVLLMAVEPQATPGEAVSKGSIVTIDAENGVVSPGKYQIFRSRDESMEPAIIKDAWVGVFPLRAGTPLDKKIVAIRDGRNKVIIRRLSLTKRNILVATADNPRTAEAITEVKKKSIVGEVIWQFATPK